MIKERFIHCDLVKSDIVLIIETLRLRIENEEDMYKIDDLEDLIKYFETMKDYGERL